MAVFLFALMLATLLVWEYLRRRKTKAEEAVEDSPVSTVDVDIQGFKMPQGVYYHPLHTWAKPMDDETAVVGVDDLARRLIGRPDSVVQPVGGMELEAGQSCVLFRKGKRRASVMSPISGEVVKVNGAIKDNPELVSSDPFGKGWIVKIRSNKLADQLSNLLAGSSAKKWMESSVRKLRLRINGAAVEYAQDGGLPLEDIGACLDSDLWARYIREFLGTEAEAE